MLSFIFFASALFSLCATSTTGRVRLSSEHIAHSGIVEIFINDQWLPVSFREACSENEGDVICRQLGFKTNTGTYKQELCSNPELYIFDMSCIGTEVSVLQCNDITTKRSASDEDNNFEACAVSCANSLTPYINSSTSLLSLYHNDDWYPVCYETITESDVTVICRELGYSEGVADSVTFDFYSTNNSALYFDGNCTGYEFSLSQCHLNDEIQVDSDCTGITVVSCFGFSQPPCPPLLYSTPTCSSITLSVSHNNHYYYIQYKVHSNDNSSDYWLKTSLRNDSIITIENLLPATLYQFNTVLVGLNDNSTASNSVLYITSKPRVQSVYMLTASNVTSTQLTLSWKLSDSLCPVVSITSFEIRLSNSVQTITVSYAASEVQNDKASYRAVLAGLTSSTRYSITLRAIGKVGNTSELVYGPNSNELFINTLSSVAGSGGSFLSNETVSVVLFILLLIIVGLIIVIGGALFLYFISKKCRKLGRKKKMRTSSLYCDTNVYITGDLSDQSYIPMSTRLAIPALDNPVTLINTRRRSSSVDRTPDCYWINLPSSQDITTFSPVLEESTDADNAMSDDDQGPTANSTSALVEGENEGGITITAATGEERPNIKIIVDDIDDDHPYDEIPGAPKRKMTVQENRDLVIANRTTFRAAEGDESRKENVDDDDDDDDEEKVYDEIPPPLTPDESSISSQDEDLPPYLLTLSQEPNELTPTFLPPPKEFADLPQRRQGAVISPIYSQAKTKPSHHKRHRSFDNEEPPTTSGDIMSSPQAAHKSEKNSLRGRTASHSLVSRSRAYTTQSVTRLDVIDKVWDWEEREGEMKDAYYNIPSTFKDPVSASNESLPASKRKDDGEYEILVHPSVSGTAIGTGPRVRRHKRPPPPVPSHPPSTKVLSILKTQTGK
ncbi:PREDICTED: uncharacterized protein LOC109580449 [Amphimedon queenslandica]|uniref:SRCR domain-containing protein n=1 Tax=Amphimedon queenslandica TaxID=400682 RepID=A0A1X7VFT5_AMPQE|nr:PREDICTED: uncharacterized protein LOC109580449 [Amphimedon queenslandica]|eukprot:XP_019849160.1 PREDICTED: uncharacterized protein LOC109580449 [Amphimedon queenslandica]